MVVYRMEKLEGRVTFPIVGRFAICSLLGLLSCGEESKGAALYGPCSTEVKCEEELFCMQSPYAEQEAWLCSRACSVTKEGPEEHSNNQNYYISEFVSASDNMASLHPWVCGSGFCYITNVRETTRHYWSADGQCRPHKK